MAEKLSNRSKGMLYRYYLKNNKFMHFNVYEYIIIKKLNMPFTYDKRGNARAYARKTLKSIFQHYKKLIPKLAKRRAWTLAKFEELLIMLANGDIDREYVKAFIDISKEALLEEDLKEINKRLSRAKATPIQEAEEDDLKVGYDPITKDKKKKEKPQEKKQEEKIEESIEKKQEEEKQEEISLPDWW